jgi:hypothetical protein
MYLYNSASTFFINFREEKENSIHQLAVLFSRQVSFSQDTANHYSLKLKIEIPAVVAGAAFCAYNFAGISKKTSSDPVFVEGLNKSDVNWFDRWGVRLYNQTADNQSYIPFYVAVPLPLVVFVFDKKLRKDFFKLSFLYAEAMISTGVLYSSAAHFVIRLRPLVYDAESPLNKRTSSDSKKSFFWPCCASCYFYIFCSRCTGRLSSQFKI